MEITSKIMLQRNDLSHLSSSSTEGVEITIKYHFLRASIASASSLSSITSLMKINDSMKQLRRKAAKGNGEQDRKIEKERETERKKWKDMEEKIETIKKKKKKKCN